MLVKRVLSTTTRVTPAISLATIPLLAPSITPRPSIRVASPDDAAAVAHLVNTALRDANLMQGDRLTTPNVLETITTSDAAAVLVACDGADIVGSIQVRTPDYVGALAVRGDWQKRGVGRQLLAAAAIHCKEVLGMTKLVGVVVTNREDHYEYYGRRGFVRTGVFMPHPEGRGLLVEVVEKPL
ncbi:Aste57867_4156 [Aphanomyces stellatus]|uniref:Aste57867_4156 protein n=1 Tax=Aphanomyces stellatus TaxID=120398 RepID=A0A485KB13_9STRA|nr:hypothetical protein As57867_004145 [Aphanomyces stellatus]VFT81283.1 Aste57867_4156 [Aphanomyces stellatus]